MEQSTCCTADGIHVAIIMDGNGRWAQHRGRPRTEGHLAGAAAVRRTVEAALELGIGTLTLHAFSSDNWKRPEQETGPLMELFEEYLRGQIQRLVDNGVRLHVAGRRDRLQAPLVEAIEAVEEATRGRRRLYLRLAVDYSARHALWQAARMCGTADEMPVFERLLARAVHEEEPAPNVDLLIRTGGEQRLSDLFGWECAHAELLFLPVLWPDFGAEDLREALQEFQRRERRFGALVPETGVESLV
ncbi:MAG: di-trans,poly-cis-decaprenylcistransferase [Acidimicrobiia bacterium]|nr:di-trans,poly-cis-decaprenylcistransferase [Acidimicrobiia bacterium]